MAGTNSVIASTARPGSIAHLGNQLLKALPLARLNRTQRNICSFMWRRTYGCNRTRNVISLREFQAACLCCKEYIARQIKILMKKRIVRRIFVPGRAPIYFLNPDVTDWEEGCIDLDALEHNHQSPAVSCAAVEMTALPSAPEASASDDSETEVDEYKDSIADNDDVPVRNKPFSQCRWQTDYIPLDLKKTRRPFGQELNSRTTQELSSRATQELNSRTTQELSSCTTQELSFRTTQELYCSTTPAHTLSRAGP